ncbi:MAG: hypothetical protein HYX93_03105, partial [Chloroflexi bacterium]|nr:hypothetical protein [Chloroflexota bacterium]
IVQILSRDDNVDLVALELPGNRLAANRDFLDDRVRILKEAQASSPKPIVACVFDGYPRLDQSTLEGITKRFTQEGIAAFHSFPGAAKALRNAVNYYSIRRLVGD